MNLTDIFTLFIMLYLLDSLGETIKNFTLFEFLVFRIKVLGLREKFFRSGKFLIRVR